MDFISCSISGTGKPRQSKRKRTRHFWQQSPVLLKFSSSLYRWVSELEDEKRVPGSRVLQWEMFRWKQYHYLLSGFSWKMAWAVWSQKLRRINQRQASRTCPHTWDERSGFEALQAQFWLTIHNSRWSGYPMATGLIIPFQAVWLSVWNVIDMVK